MFPHFELSIADTKNGTLSLLQQVHPRMAQGLRETNPYGYSNPRYQPQHMRFHHPFCASPAGAAEAARGSLGMMEAAHCASSKLADPRFPRFGWSHGGAKGHDNQIFGRESLLVSHSHPRPESPAWLGLGHGLSALTWQPQPTTTSSHSSCAAETEAAGRSRHPSELLRHCWRAVS